MKRFIIFSLCLVAVLSSCARFEQEDLLGRWSNERWLFEFQEDGTVLIGQNGKILKENTQYRTFINSIEITEDNQVFMSNITIVSLEPKQKLVLEFREILGTGKGTIHEELTWEK